VAIIAVEAGVSSLFNVEQTDSQELLSIAIGQRTLTDENIPSGAVFMSKDFQSHSSARRKQ
jgi:hypothetical protein